MRTILAVLLLATTFGAGHAAVAEELEDGLILIDQFSEPYAWPGGLTAFGDRPYLVHQGTGVIIDVDPDGPRILVDGRIFRFSIDAEVRLLSGFGAPTLLRPGMELEFYFREDIAGAAGEIVAAAELPAGSVQQD